MFCRVEGAWRRHGELPDSAFRAQRAHRCCTAFATSTPPRCPSTREAAEAKWPHRSADLRLGGRSHLRSRNASSQNHFKGGATHRMPPRNGPGPVNHAGALQRKTFSDTAICVPRRGTGRSQVRPIWERRVRRNGQVRHHLDQVLASNPRVRRGEGESTSGCTELRFSPPELRDSCRDRAKMVGRLIRDPPHQWLLSPVACTKQHRFRRDLGSNWYDSNSPFHASKA